MIPTTLRYELPREALLEKLNASEASLLQVLAPSGFGKTTLLAQYARASGRRVLWRSLSVSDRDPQTFLAKLRTLLEQAMPDVPLAELRDRTISAQDCALGLNASNHDLLLVLDDFNDMHAATLQWLGEFLVNLHENHQVVLGGYTRPELPLPLRYQAEQVLVLDGRQLSFTGDETEQYLARRGMARPDELQTRGLVGWPAGLALLSSGAYGALSPMDLVRQLLQSLPDAVRQGLCEAVVLPRWNEQTARSYGLALPPGWLDVVQRAGLPMTPLDAQTSAPHQVVVDVLHQILQQSPARARSLYLLAGQRAEQAGEPLQALQAYRHADARDAATELVSALATEYLWRQDFPSLGSVIEDLQRWAPLPGELAQLLALAFVRTNRISEGEQLAAQFVERDPTAAEALRALGHAAMRRGDRELQLHYARQLALHAQTRSQRLDASRLEIAALLRYGHSREALERAQALLQTNDAVHPLEWAAVYSAVHSVHEALGQWADSEAYLRRALDIYEALKSTQQTAASLNALALVYGRQGRTTEALGTVQRALNLVGSTAPDSLGLYTETQADLLLWDGQMAAAEQAYQRALDPTLGVTQTPLGTRIQLGRVLALTQLSELDQAQRALDLTATQASDTQLRAQALFLQGMLAYVRQEPAQALAQWSQVPGVFVTDLQRLYELAAQGEGAALTPTSRAQARILVASLPAPVLRSHQQTLGPFLGQIQYEVTQHQTARLTRPLLTVRTLGRLQVSLNGQPLQLPFARTGELLAYLVLVGPVLRGDIINDLWDASTEVRHINYFKLTTRKLRAALQTAVQFNPLTYEGGQYTLSEHLEIQCDAVDVLAARHSLDPDKLISVIASSGGPFMPQAEGTWMDEQRTELHTTLIDMGVRVLQLTPLEQALPSAQRLLEQDPLSSEIYEALIEAYVRAGDDAGARQTYQAYARMLARAFGSRPPFTLIQRYASSST